MTSELEERKKRRYEFVQDKKSVKNISIIVLRRSCLKLKVGQQIQLKNCIIASTIEKLIKQSPNSNTKCNC